MQGSGCVYFYITLASVAEGLNDKPSVAGASLILRGTSGIPGYRCLGSCWNPKTSWGRVPWGSLIADPWGLRYLLLMEAFLYVISETFSTELRRSSLSWGVWKNRLIVEYIGPQEGGPYFSQPMGNSPALHWREPDFKVALWRHVTTQESPWHLAYIPFLEAFSKINKRLSDELAQSVLHRWGNCPKEMTLNSKFYSEFAAELEQETNLCPSVLEKLQRSDAKYGCPAPRFCYMAKNPLWFLITWLLPWDSFDVLVYLLALLSEWDQLQTVQRAFLYPVHLWKDREILSPRLMLISSNIWQRELGLIAGFNSQSCFLKNYFPDYE